MLTFGVTGGHLKYAPGVSGYLYKLRRWAPSSLERERQAEASSSSAKVWTSFFEVGLGSALRANRPYNIKVDIRGSSATLFVDGVEIGRSVLPPFAIPGYPCGIFCGGLGKIHFRNIMIEAATPNAFVVMQFDTPEYDALFRDVIVPVCTTAGLQPYRADFTYMPGLIVDDIKRQIAEAKVVIAEISPSNPNVYYEIGYADVTCPRNFGASIT